MGESIYFLSNKHFNLKIKDAGIYSFKCNQAATDIEFIEDACLFGHVHLTYKTEHESWAYSKTEHCEYKIMHHDERTYAVKYDWELLGLTVTYRLEKNYLEYSLAIENKTNVNIEIGDLSIPFPMNSNFNWGDDANLKVLRHSFISGHNSYIFWERCNGVAPYLLMTPMNHTHFEYYQMFPNQLKEKRQAYEAFIYSKVEGDVAKEKGCSWRQPNTSVIIASNDSLRHEFKFQWKENYDEIRDAIVDEGLINIHVVPGMTIPNDLEVKFSIQSNEEIHDIIAEFPNETDLQLVEREGNRFIYRVKFNRLGENLLSIAYGNNKVTRLEFFSTEPLQTLIEKRAAFITKCQIKDPSLWYDGLLAEWNMQTKTLLSPDNYDCIKGWRIYEVTCDDPGLSKPAYLSTKLIEFPNQEEVSALDYYIENFVWGGLQKTEEEEFSYGIYGIPDWKVNRDSISPNADGKLHIWRIYDYPHIALMYFNMYLVGKYYPDMNLSLRPIDYLIRSYKTAVAMFTIPLELAEWSAYKTGLYNELVIVDLIKELYECGLSDQSKRLELLWEKKVKHFVLEKPDVFGSEYPFDTTGFESTYALAEYALKQAKTMQEVGTREEDVLTIEKVNKFMTLQRKCNIATRGWLEPAYYLLGSDYRTENTAYTLSYMAQMGTNGILTYALHQDVDHETEDLIRLGYASLLSSWALMNTGTKESNYGYWFNGIENDGGAGGGFEPAPYGETWLNQPHSRGSWYYSCEIDLGFCGALRSATTVIHHDSIFGFICYGGDVTSSSNNISVVLKDGLRRRLSWVRDHEIFNFEIKGSKISSNHPVHIKQDLTEVEATFEVIGGSQKAYIQIEGLKPGTYEICLNDEVTFLTIDSKALATQLYFKDTNSQQFKLRKC